ncbi:hypothetical protein GHT06_021001 [Daphnia sinensis]|uniref:Uncharacterized protein n=1 Tax=Daphnia sinensis TaxID=1820382 RepID=A0AAD5PQF5_9CRUS|nr:hypothetical protein GHT06_021001 [Daphnia sinensis]
MHAHPGIRYPRRIFSWYESGSRVEEPRNLETGRTKNKQTSAESAAHHARFTSIPRQSQRGPS